LGFAYCAFVLQIAFFSFAVQHFKGCALTYAPITPATNILSIDIIFASCKVDSKVVF
jgi:hypothetical protein